MSAVVVGTVQSIARYPVKSMLGEELDIASVAARGVVGDRAYALIDDETGKVVSVKYPRRWGRIFELHATTQPAGVNVVFPDGQALSIEDPDLPRVLSRVTSDAPSRLRHLRRSTDVR